MCRVEIHLEAMSNRHGCSSGGLRTYPPRPLPCLHMPPSPTVTHEALCSILPPFSFFLWFRWWRSWVRTWRTRASTG